MRAVAMVATMLAVAGCGTDIGGGNFSCDVTSGGTHTCTDYSWDSAAYSSIGFSSACTSAGGSPGSGCSHTGAIGGCKVTTNTGTVSINTTTWSFTGKAADLMTACTAQKGTFVTP